MSKLDVFAYCGALRVMGHLMILAVVGLCACVYYTILFVYGPSLLRGSTADRILAFVVLSLTTFLGGMLLWSYFVATFSSPGLVPHGWHPFETAQEADAMRERILASQAPLPALPGHTKARFCRKCSAWKPPRAHHCNVTGRCVLKMDHFCLWVVNTVGLLNYKAFLLFLVYSLLASGVAFAALLPALIRLVTHGQLANREASFLFMSVILTLTFFIALLMFLGLHWDMVAHNYTSIESIDYSLMRESWPWDQGVKRNFEEVFGRRRNWRWLPLLSNDDREWMKSQSLDASLQLFQFQLHEASASSV